MIDGTAVEAIRDLAQKAQFEKVTQESGSLTYRVAQSEHGRELGSLVEPPAATPFKVSTLTGLLDSVGAVTANFAASDFALHVRDPFNVDFVPTQTDRWGRRLALAQATHVPPGAFTFDTFYTDLQKFIIGLQVQFLTTDNLLYLIKIASNLKAGNSIQVSDDGFNQTVVLAAGEVSTLEKKIEPRIKLIPLRTFHEAAPCETEFLIRFKQSQQETPQIAIFDCQGGKWKNDAMGSIKDYLVKQLAERKLPAFPVLA